jgi:chromosome segregation ATPase
MQNAQDLSNAGETTGSGTPESASKSRNLGSATYQRLQAALSNEAALTSGTYDRLSTEGINLTDTMDSADAPKIFAPDLSNRKRLSPAERELLTQQSVTPILEQWSSTSERLQNAMQRIGYLECQVEVMQDNLKGVPELRAKATRAIILEIENNSLSAKLAEREERLGRREKQLLSRNQEIELLTKVLDAHKKHLSRIEGDLATLEQKPWVRFFSWLLGSK